LVAIFVSIGNVETNRDETRLQCEVCRVTAEVDVR